MKLRLAENLTLPVDAVTQTFAIFGKRGSGKTNGATVLVEELLKAEQPVVVLDPVDAWHGLKSSFDGKHPGFSIYVFGGAHGDLPLEPSAGTLIADIVAHQRISLVLSMKEWSGGERARFVTDFAKRLLQVNHEPLMVVCEEADAFIPQRPMKGEEAMLGAMDRLVRWGRQSGVGCTIVTQRSAKVNKDVTTQAETLIAFRTTGPQDRDAIDNWIKYHAGEEKREEVLSTLPTLPTGTAWVWSPEWLEILKPVAFRRRETFDSAATPKPGEKARKPKQRAAVDLERLRADMAATIEKAKADDPRELRKQIAELKKQLVVGTKQVPEQHSKSSARPALTDADRTLLEKVAGSMTALRAKLAEHIEARVAGMLQDFAGVLNRACLDSEALWERARQDFERTLDRKDFQKILGKLSAVQQPRVDARLFYNRPQTPPPPSKHRPVVQAADSDVRLNRLAERKVLQVLAQYGPRTKRQLAIQAGYAMNGGGFAGALSKLRTAGYIHTNGAGTFVITETGQAAIGPVDPLPSGRALIDFWLQQFNRLAEREVLRVVVEAYPKALTHAEIASQTNPPYESKGGGFLGAVSKLRTLGLIEGRGELRASEELFDV